MATGRQRRPLMVRGANVGSGSCFRFDDQGADLQVLSPMVEKNGPPEGKPLTCLVAGAGFEPATFGL